MIIPPDPEKDPRLFDPSSSTPSLLLEAQPPLDSDGDVGEYLPPYERREMSQREGHIGVTIPYRPDPPLPFNTNTETITPTSTIGESAFASTSRLPFHHIPTDTPASSTAKLWESSSSTSSVGISARRKGKARAFFGLPPKPKWVRSTSLDSSSTDDTRFTTWYKRYKRWIWAILVFALIGVGLMIGLLAGLGTGQMKEQPPVVGSGPAWHDVEPGDQKWNLAWADGSMNLTWKDSRDAPPPTDGALSNCNTFLPLNTSDPTLNFSSLSTPYPSNKLWVSTYRIPLVGLNMSTIPYSVIPPPGGPNSTDPNPNPSPNSTRTSPSSTATSKSKPSSTPSSPPAIPDALGLLSPLPFFSRGIASSGSVEFIGKDAPVEVITGGEEGVVRVDVVVQYGGVQGVEGIMRVCEVSEGDVMGVGVYTPIQTDGKITNPYSLDPTQLPSFHIIVRFPPSLFNLTTISTYTNTSTSGINTTSDLNTSNTSLALSALSLTTPPPPGPLYLHSLSLTLDKMGVRLGDLDGIARFGTWNLTSTRGGAVVKSLSAKRVWVQTAENAVRGRFNVSESLYINSTDSSILADIVLHDPSSTTNTTLPRSSVASRGLPPPGYSNSTNTTLASSLANSTASTLTHNYTHTVNVTLHTSDGLIRLKYLAQPPQTALSSWVSLSSGEMDISVHPNYIGPFACKNAWGAVRLPPPSTRQWDDPLGQSRTRAVVQGVINIPDGSLFQRGGLNETLLPMSGTTVTGAAYWQSGNQTLTPQAVQDEEEGKRGNQMLLLGGWGDVTLRFDGS